MDIWKLSVVTVLVYDQWNIRKIWNAGEKRSRNSVTV